MRVPTPRRPFAVAALAFLLAINLSCGGDSGDPSPTPTSVLVTPGADTLLSVGETQAFVAVVLDANGDPIDDAEIAWSSTAPGVVTVDPSTGIATAVTNGSAQVRATSGALEGTAPVTVAQVPTTVTVSPATGNFTFAGDTLTFTATVLDAGGTPVAPVQRIWAINDNAVAVIDSNGFVRAKGAGIAMVTVVAIGPGGARAGYAAVNSTQPVYELYIRNQPTIVVAGEALDPAIQVEVRDSGGTVVTGYAGLVTLGIEEGPDGGVIRGTRNVNAINGVASFSGLTLERTGSYRLRANADSVFPVYSAFIEVYPDFPHHVQLVTDPVTSGGVVAGVTIPITAVIADRLGNARPDSQTAVTLIVEDALPGGELFGSNQGVWNSAGYYEFPGAHFRKAQTSYALKVFAIGIEAAITEEFAVSPAAPFRIVLTGDSGIRVGTFIGAPATAVSTVDQFGNPTFGDTLRVAFSTWWAFAAPAGKGQRVLPEDTAIVIGQGPVGPLHFVRPGPTMLIASGPGLMPDSGPVQNARFSGASVAYIGPHQVCFNDRYCAGANDHGELGVDPALLTEDSVFVLYDSTGNDYGPIVFGGTSACAIDYVLPGSIPTVMCRGANDEGQLGRGSAGAFDEQWVRISGATGWWTVAMGDAHACALAADSTAVCWGRNDHGQLGRGTTSAFEATPTAVFGGTKFKVIAAGGDHTCGITTGSAMLCWGENGSGQLGDSTVADTSAPVAVVGGYVWAEVVAGAEFTCGVKTNAGRYVLCWGANDVGQLGDAAAGAGRIYPDLVTGGLNDLPFGTVAGRAHACTLANGTIICWGDDSRGQIGNGPGTTPVHSPYGKTLPESQQEVSLAAGGDQTCAVGYSTTTLRQTLYCWGANHRGQLGVGSTTDVDMIGEPWQ
jgi:hypothetical protein